MRTAQLKRAEINKKYVSKSKALRQFRAWELGKRSKDLLPEDLVPNFHVGEHVLVAIPVGDHPDKLVAYWRGPFRVVAARHNFVYEAEHRQKNGHQTRQRHKAQVGDMCRS